MKNQNLNRFTFEKKTIVELNDSVLMNIQGGSVDTISQAVQQVLQDVHNAAYNVSYVATKAIMTR